MKEGRWQKVGQNKTKVKDEMKENVVGRENRDESIWCVSDVKYNEGQN